MADQSTAELTIYEQRVRLLQRHRQQWRDLSAFVVTSCHKLHKQHRQQRGQLVNATIRARQALIQQQIDRLRERHQANQVLRDQLRAEQQDEWTALNTPSNQPPE